MWHEARKHERKLRGMMVDYKKRAERRREYYEKIVSNCPFVSGKGIDVGCQLMVSHKWRRLAHAPQCCRRVGHTDH
ncbi:hypothetical protein P7K49_034570 [Saguinus oedipus]|uniref:Uncharacterized protein n=1 Tax=Saguinus oedipus TaxID=9490 RepID=A0ABQ9TV53_SAGOE|nr:hypothetical protein P7K49_034570 [Saguinus oedipus]